MPEPHIGLLITEGVALAAILPVRARLEARSIPVVLIVPTGGPLLTLSGRYFPGAGGHGTHRTASQVSPGELDLLVLPDGLTSESLARYPQVGALITGQAHPVPVLPFAQFLRLLERQVSLDGLAHGRGVLTGR